MNLLAETLGIAILLGLFYLFLILNDIEEKPAYAVGLKRAFPLGALLVFTMVLANSIFERRWDNDYVIGFLLLKEVGRWPFRILTGLGYILFMLGITSIIAIIIKKIIRK